MIAFIVMSGGSPETTRGRKSIDSLLRFCQCQGIVKPMEEDTLLSLGFLRMFWTI